MRRVLETNCNAWRMFEPDEYEKNVAGEIIPVINKFFNGVQVGLEIANRSHRTIQQHFANIVIGFIIGEYYNAECGLVDRRNEITADFCDRLVNMILDGALGEDYKIMFEKIIDAINNKIYIPSVLPMI